MALAIVLSGRICVLQVLAEDNYFKILPTVETELKITQSALGVHMRCTPFVKD